MGKASEVTALDARHCRAIQPLSWPAVAALLMLLLAAPPLAAAAERPALLEAGARMPPLRGDLLSGRAFVLPDSMAGTHLLLLLGFSYESRHDVEQWAARFKPEFGRDTSIACFEIPVIGGMARIAKPFIDGGMRKGTPRELHERVLTVYNGSPQWKTRMGVADEAACYLLFVGRDGRVALRMSGPFSEEAWRVLAATIRAATR